MVTWGGVRAIFQKALTAILLSFAAAALPQVAACDRPATAHSVAQAEAEPEATSFHGRVVGIADGDTITVLVDRRREAKIRFAEIDAPERNQPWGARSKEALSDLVYGRDVRVHQTDTDRWGRVIGRVFVGGRDVNREMIALGAAWAYRQYLTDPTLLDVEARARRDRRGLWSMPQAQTVEPWEWRRGRRASVPDETAAALPAARGLLGPAYRPSTANGAFTCGSKTRCSQMRSCGEARFYRTQCRLGGLDGNRDGVPCEKICGAAG